MGCLRAVKSGLFGVVSVLASGCAEQRAELSVERGQAEWVALFDGETLDGWVPTGNPEAWDVEDGEIVVTDAGGGGWLRTDRMYRDFVLELEFLVPPGGNSGVGLRGSSHGDPAFTGFEVQILDSRGERPNLRNCGAVYEAIEPDLMAVNPAGEWNTYRIRLVGDTLNVWLNNARVHWDEKLDERGFYRSPANPLPLRDRMPTGYIALQDHGDPVRFRNIRIRDLSPDPEPAGMVHLIGESAEDGWFAEDDARWSVEEGTLIGQRGPGHLFTEREWSDFEMRALVWVNRNGNSGMYFRTRPNPDPDNPWPIGYEAQVDNHDPKNFTGCIYDRAWADELITRDEAWFDYRIRAEGDRIRTWVNGVPMVDARLEEFDRGRMAVQGHHAGNVIMYRDIRVLDLSGE